MPAGAIHPDLVARLSEEANKAASHVLAMCVRALDYCPPVDLTFGEYLRALITADADLVRDDDRNYRVAFAEAFRRRGIYPRDVRTLSVENLLWRASDNDARRPSEELIAIFGRLREFGHRQLYASDRRQIFDQARDARRALHGQLAAHFKSGQAGVQDGLFLGLDVAGRTFEVHSVHFASRIGPDGDLLLQAIVQIAQEMDLSVDATDEEQGRMRFQGGCTVVVDLKEPKIAFGRAWATASC
jgi:hypothetical protein